MAKISAVMVKELRERTGAGMMECKKALVVSEGNIEQAIDDMRKAGSAKADKKASRVAAEGIVVIKSEQGRAVMLEVNSETDFSARDANFTQFVDQVAQTVLTSGETDVVALGATVLSNGEGTVEEERKHLITKIGENISVRRAASYQGAGHIGAYLHGDRIGVLVELEGGDAELAKDIAMHVAASNPMVISANDVPADVVAKEKEIFIAQAVESGKPQAIAEKMTTGRLRKFLAEVSLEGQAFVKDPTQTIAALLPSKQARVLRFDRFGVGEGIEKEEVDFVKEVMEQAGV